MTLRIWHIDSSKDRESGKENIYFLPKDHLGQAYSPNDYAFLCSGKCIVSEQNLLSHFCRKCRVQPPKRNGNQSICISCLFNSVFFLIALEMVEHERHVFQIRPGPRHYSHSHSPMSGISDLRISSIFRRDPMGTPSSSDSSQEHDNLLIPANHCQLVEHTHETRLPISRSRRGARNFSPPQDPIRDITSYFKYDIANETL
jgi:hypothetical protein